MTNFTTTMADLRIAGACYAGYNKVVRALQGKELSERDVERQSYIRFAHEEPIPLLSILESNGLDDALWALRCVKDADRDCRLFAVWCARQVQPLIQDQHSLNTLDVAEKFANGQATQAELEAARLALSATWDVARATRPATWDAWAAMWAARSATWEVAWAAVWAVAWSFVGSAVGEAIREKQKEMFVKMCQGQAPWQGTDNAEVTA